MEIARKEFKWPEYITVGTSVHKMTMDENIDRINKFTLSIGKSNIITINEYVIYDDEIMIVIWYWKYSKSHIFVTKLPADGMSRSNE